MNSKHPNRTIHLFFAGTKGGNGKTIIARINSAISDITKVRDLVNQADRNDYVTSKKGELYHEKTRT